jgi:hypothetical protein
VCGDVSAAVFVPGSPQLSAAGDLPDFRCERSVKPQLSQHRSLFVSRETWLALAMTRL